jgi:hypothetical protein
VRVVLAGDGVQGHSHADSYRLAEVQGLGGIGQNPRHVPKVRVHVVGDALRGTGEQRAGVGEDDRIVVDVDNPAVRCYLVGGGGISSTLGG